jgi:hypothetical protein
MRLMVMNDFKRVGVGAGVFSGGSAATWWYTRVRRSSR